MDNVRKAAVLVKLAADSVNDYSLAGAIARGNPELVAQRDARSRAQERADYDSLLNLRNRLVTQSTDKFSPYGGSFARQRLPNLEQAIATHPLAQQSNSPTIRAITGGAPLEIPDVPVTTKSAPVGGTTPPNFPAFNLGQAAGDAVNRGAMMQQAAQQGPTNVVIAPSNRINVQQPTVPVNVASKDIQQPIIRGMRGARPVDSAQGFLDNQSNYNRMGVKPQVAAAAAAAAAQPVAAPMAASASSNPFKVQKGQGYSSVAQAYNKQFGANLTGMQLARMSGERMLRPGAEFDLGKMKSMIDQNKSSKNYTFDNDMFGNKQQFGNAGSASRMLHPQSVAGLAIPQTGRGGLLPQPITQQVNPPQPPPPGIAGRRLAF